jgi:hypothetical protein
VGCDKADLDPHKSGPNQPGPDTDPSQQATTESSSSAGAEPTIVYKKGPKPGANTVLAEAGDIEVTLSDFERAMRRSTLVAPDGQLEVSKQRLARPQLQMTVVRNLLSSKIIDQQAAQRGLAASLDEKVAALESTGRLAPYADFLKEGRQNEDAPEVPALKKRGLTVDDLDAIATDMVLRDKLRDVLVTQIDDDQLWDAYRQQNDRIRLLVASVRNTPTMDEITGFIDTHLERIEEHFERHKKKYRRPAMVRLATVAPEPGRDADPAVLEQAATRLKKGDDPDKVAADLGMRADADARLVRGENPEAFDAEVTSTGFQTQGARGAYAWRVRGKRDSKEPKLTASLQREIAAELLRHEDVVASKGKRIKEAIAAMKKLELPQGDAAAKAALDALEAKLEAKNVEVEQTPMFPRNARGFIPGVGLAEEVAEQAYQLDLDDPVADEPILSRAKVWAVRVLDHQTKDREAFEEDKEAFRQEYAKRVRDRLVDQFVSHVEDQANTTLDLVPLQIKYGKLQKR